MALGQKSNRALVPQAQMALEQLKQEVASEVAAGPDQQGQSLQSWYQSGYGGEVPSRVWGSVGGNMVRRMIAAAQQSMIQQATHATQSAFRQSLAHPEQSGQSGQNTTNPFTVQVPRAD